MYFDALTLAAIAAELRATVLDGRVQDVLPAGPLDIGLEIYAVHERHYVLLSADRHTPRVHLASAKLRRGVETDSPLLLRLRKDLEGAFLTDIRQPPFERVLELVFENVALGEVKLIAECFERRANLVVVQAGLVRECAVRVGAEINRARVTLPGRPYQPPPPHRKPAPNAVTPDELRALLLVPDPAWRVLMAGMQGVSPLIAQEAVFRATGASKTPAMRVSAPEALLAALAELYAPVRDGAWEPCLVYDDEEPVAYAPYALTHLAEGHRIEGTDTASIAVERFYAASFGAHAYDARKGRVRAQFDAAAERLARKREALQRELEGSAQVETLRQSGELILAYSRAIKPRQRELRAAYEVDGPELVIALNPDLTAVQNAQDYFKRYDKAKTAARELPARVAAVDADLAYLAQLRADLDLADSFPAIDDVRRELEETGWLGEPGAGKRRQQPAGPLRVVSADGYVIWVGRNARQNEQVTFKRARPNDLWLHAHGVPGAHVIVVTGGRPVAESTLQQAAALAAQHSALRNEAHVAVDIAPRKAVRRIPGGRPGMVTYRAERTITIGGV